MISKGCKSVSKKDVLSKISEGQILAHYFGITEVPCLINSPLRKDENASFGIYSPNGTDINFQDFGSSDKGSIFTLLHKLWNLEYHDVYSRILNEVPNNIKSTIKACKIHSQSNHKKPSSLEVKTREWKEYDLEWWGQYGITQKALIAADIHPISHILFTKDKKQYAFPADKYAYVYIERKEGKITKKVYQPLNTRGHKWCQDNDKSVLGLWTLLPKVGKIMCICSSVKDALTLRCNCHIPTICMQGEGYEISNTVINELKARFKHVYIILDNDVPGIQDSKKLSIQTGFTNIILPQFEGGKDIADYRKLYGHDKFVQLIKNLFKNI